MSIIADFTTHDRSIFALEFATKLAAHHFPDEATRIERGAQIVRDERIERTEHGALVESNTQCGTRYEVNGTCQCVAQHHHPDTPHYRCSHRWALLLARKVDDILAAQWHATMDGQSGIATPFTRDNGCTTFPTPAVVVNTPEQSFVFQAHDDPTMTPCLWTAVTLFQPIEA